MITRPMLAPNDKWEVQQNYVKFPCIASPKADGFRCYKANGLVLTRSGEQQPNLHVRSLIETLPDGLDGELIVGNNFRQGSSALSSYEGTPDFTFHIFDYVKDSLTKPYVERLADLNALTLPAFCKILPTYTINSMEELLDFRNHCIKQGCDGVIARQATGPYKCNRGTLKEGWIIKVKPFEYSEARILEILEANKNNNEASKSNLGFTKRSTSKAGKVGKGIMGAIVVQDIHNNKTFKLGTGEGWDIPFKKDIFENPDKYMTKIVRYKFLDVGDYDLPRNASMDGFRESWDMGGSEECGSK